MKKLTIKIKVAGLLTCMFGLNLPVAVNATSAHLPIGPMDGSQSAKWNDKWLYASEKQGLFLSDKQAVRQVVAGNFTYLDVAKDIALTYDINADQIKAIRLAQPKMHTLGLLPKRDIEIEWLCLQPREADNNLYAWIGNEAGQAEQWLLMSKSEWKPQLLRSLSVTMGAINCAVDSQHEQLYVIENATGIWRYPAAPFAPAEGELALYQKENSFTDIGLYNGEILIFNDSGQIFGVDGELYSQAIEGLDELESFAVDATNMTVYSDADGRYYQLPWQAVKAQAKANNELIVEIPTQVESGTADRAGDTMDDPAIWVHPKFPEKSRILGTNKRWGLLSFDMQGQQVQALEVGRINNVDVRQKVMLGGQYRDIAAASNRDRDSLSLFEIDSQGDITVLAEQPTSLKDIYGLCMYQPKPDELYAFANDKSGIIAQYRLSWQHGGLIAKEVGHFTVPSQPEGCVADDDKQQLFVGEEDVGIWQFDLTQSPIKGKLIIEAGGPLVADVEGIDLYHKNNDETYLVVSSQGNDSYLLYEAKKPFAYIGRFRIGVNGDKGYDGSGETDGLAVTARPVGQGVWSQGMLVVQDGRNRLPDAHQNFKWVPWSMISEALGL
ncbi:phytase [Shewanella holmiensis]|uniref:Phytase n=1 Tax=Shewanella holmiensis TaxID=2952222 RepID=A0A9X2WKE6_9GAMM|nr:phytase [Shewanella holmiensis]MCT7941017.1 phytase [Shewanella holmiensis]